jgi:hypothetical protein
MSLKPALVENPSSRGKAKCLRCNCLRDNGAEELIIVPHKVDLKPWQVPCNNSGGEISLRPT